MASFLSFFSILIIPSLSLPFFLTLSSLLFYIPHFAMVTTADPEHLSHLRHFTQYLIGSFQIKHSNCVYKSPLGFQALFLLHIHFKSNSDVHAHTHAYWQKLLITFNAKQNKQTADWFCWVRLPNHDGIIQRFLSVLHILFRFICVFLFVFTICSWRPNVDPGHAAIADYFRTFVRLCCIIQL